jgi:plasmid stabilization system protein ParE
MSYEITILKRAVSDIDDICRYLSQFYPGTAGKFLDSLEHILDEVAKNPYIFSKYPENKKYHRMLIQNYLVFYRIFETSKTVRVYRIIHGKRDIASLMR